MIYKFGKDREVEAPNLRELGWKVVTAYQVERARGGLNDPEWNQFLQEGVEKALADDDPTEFCWSGLIAMHLGGPDVPVAERETSKWADYMQQWADLAYECGILKND